MIQTLLAALLAATVPHTLPPNRPALVVAVEQDTTRPLDAAALVAVDQEVGRLWRPYADVTVRTDADAAVLAADDALTLVITDRLSDSGDGLGWIVFADGRPTHTIYVSRSEIARLAVEGRIGGREIADWPAAVRQVFLVRAVARAIAHEVGHYLLRSREHAATGLMRPRFTFRELMDASAATYRLDASEEAILQQRVRAYLLARNGLHDDPTP
jgi:hypothetical protein